MNCAKKRYDRVGALIAVADLVRKSKRNSQQAQRGEDARAYRCADCGSWHVTSQPARAGEEAVA